MFIIASSGRCGTQAICHGLDQYSDHVVRHEPEPLLLNEAYLKHHRKPYATSVLEERLRIFAEKAEQYYGESVRAANLLPDIQVVAPHVRFLIIVRDPLKYILSAHSKRVFRKGGVWDETRIVPLDFGSQFADLNLSEKIAWHWVEVNRYLLNFAESGNAATKVVILGDLEVNLPKWTRFVEATITNPEGLAHYLRGRPNAATSSELPEGYDEGRLREITRQEWSRARALSERQ